MSTQLFVDWCWDWTFAFSLDAWWFEIIILIAATKFAEDDTISGLESLCRDVHERNNTGQDSLCELDCSLQNEQCTFFVHFTLQSDFVEKGIIKHIL